MNGLGKRAEKRCHFGSKLGAPSQLADSVDDGAAHDHAVGEFGNLSGLGGI